MFKLKNFKLSTFLYFFSIIILTESSYISLIGPIHKYIYVPSTFIIFFILILITIKNKLFNKLLVHVVLFYIVIFIPTIIYSGDLSTLFNVFVKVFSFLLLINTGIHKDKEKFIKILGFVFYLYSIINIMTMLLYPTGTYLDDCWFLGHKNGLIKWLLPGVAFVGIPNLVKNNKISNSTWIYIFITIISIILGGSSTSLVSILILLIILYLIQKNYNISNAINPNKAMIANIVFFVSIVLLRLQNYFEYFIVVFLGKELNFTGRVFLWDRIIVYIFQKPLLGHGITNSLIMYQQLQYTNASSHNIILDYLYEGGILCLVILFLIFYITNKKTKKLVKNYKKTMLFLYGVFFSFSISWMTDTYINYNMMNIFALLMIMYNMNIICKSGGD